MKKNISINSIAELKNNIKNSGNVITLESDLKVEQSDLNQGSNTLELELASSVVINGNGKIIDFTFRAKTRKAEHSFKYTLLQNGKTKNFYRNGERRRTIS